MTAVKRYRISGRVQGVGFRFFVFRRASEIGLDGWVRNMRDGTVEAVIRGDDEQHRKIAAALAEGPRWSKVRAVECVEEPNAVVDAGFEIAADGY